MERTRVTEEWSVQSERKNRGGELRRKKGEKGLREREDEEKERAEKLREGTRVTDKWNVQSERERWKEEKVQAEGVTPAGQLEVQAWLR